MADPRVLERFICAMLGATWQPRQSRVLCSFSLDLENVAEGAECGTKRYSGQQVTISLLRYSPPDLSLGSGAV